MRMLLPISDGDGDALSEAGADIYTDDACPEADKLELLPDKRRLCLGRMSFCWCRY